MEITRTLMYNPVVDQIVIGFTTGYNRAINDTKNCKIFRQTRR